MEVFFQIWNCFPNLEFFPHLIFFPILDFFLLLISEVFRPSFGYILHYFKLYLNKSILCLCENLIDMTYHRYTPRNLYMSCNDAAASPPGQSLSACALLPA